MYVIIDKKTKKITHINHAPFKQELTDERQYYRFDPKTMDMGHADADPSSDQVPEDESSGAISAGHRPSLAIQEQKQYHIQRFSRLALEERRRILPDYKLHNVSLGIYNKKRIATYRATVQAFRQEVHRLETLVEQARTEAALEAICPHFPAQLVT